LTKLVNTWFALEDNYRLLY